MRLVGNLFKVIVGIVGSIVAVGCDHFKGEEVKTYYGPVPVPKENAAPQDPALVPSAKDIEEPPSDIYGPPEMFGNAPDPLPEVEEEPKKIYGPPEGVQPEPEPLPQIVENPKPVYGPPPEDLDPVVASRYGELRITNITTAGGDRLVLTLEHAGSDQGVKQGATGALLDYAKRQIFEFHVSDVHPTSFDVEISGVGDVIEAKEALLNVKEMRFDRKKIYQKPSHENPSPKPLYGPE